LLDLDDVIVHALIARAREFYQLEKPGSVDRAKERKRAASFVDTVLKVNLK